MTRSGACIGMVRLHIEPAIERRLLTGRGCPSAGWPRVTFAFGTTQRYAHLIDAPLRSEGDTVADMLKPRMQVVGEGDTAGTRSNVASC